MEDIHVWNVLLPLYLLNGNSLTAYVLIYPRTLNCLISLGRPYLILETLQLSPVLPGSPSSPSVKQLSTPPLAFHH